MSLRPAASTEPVAEVVPEAAFSALAVASSGEPWVAVDASRMPRQAFDLVIAFARAYSADALLDLVSLRNALTRDGTLLVVVGPRGAWGDLRDLAVRAGFTRVRELSSRAHEATLELQR